MHVWHNTYHKEMDLTNWVQILDKAVCISLGTNALKKNMNVFVLLSAIGKIVRETRFSNLDKATSLKGKVQIQNLRSIVKENLWHISCINPLISVYPQKFGFTQALTRKIICEGNPIVQIFNWTVGPSFITINRRVHHHIHILMAVNSIKRMTIPEVKLFATVSQVQILDKAVCVSFCTNALGKSINPSLLPPDMGK